MVLAAGAGRRLESLTEDLPKTLLPVDGDRTILDIALGNLGRAGMETSWWSPATRPSASRSAGPRSRSATASRSRPSSTRRRRSGTTATRCGARASTSRAACCSATATPCTRPRSRSGCWPARGHSELVLALDDAKPLGEEEMKVLLNGDGLLRGINKAHDPPRRRASTSA